MLAESVSVAVLVDGGVGAAEAVVTGAVEMDPTGEMLDMVLLSADEGDEPPSSVIARRT